MTQPETQPETKVETNLSRQNNVVELEYARLTYAKIVLANAGISANYNLETAYASIKREQFLPPPPWVVAGHNRSRELPSLDPVIVYQDVLFEINRLQSINNGSPSLHAWALNQLNVVSGQNIVHLGCGLGYYTAIMAHMVGPTGKITCVEADKVLSDSLLENLSGYANVQVINGNGADWPQESCDLIYVNYAVFKPSFRWFEHLSDGGKLLFPLGVPARSYDGSFENYTSKACIILVERTGERFTAQYLGDVMFVCDSTAASDTYRDDIKALEKAFNGGGVETISALRIGGQHMANEWYSSEEWGLACA